MRFVKRKEKSTVKKMNTLWNLGALDEFFCKQPVNMQCIEMWRTIHRGQCTSPLFLLDPLYRGRVYKWKFCTFVHLLASLWRCSYSTSDLRYIDISDI